MESDSSGKFAFKTVKLGSVTAPDMGALALHILMAVHMRGLLTHVITRIYFWTSRQTLAMLS